MGTDFTHIKGVSTCNYCMETEVFDIVADIDTEEDNFSLDELHDTLSSYLDYIISDNDGCTYEWDFDDYNLATCPRCKEKMTEEAEEERARLVRDDIRLRAFYANNER